MFLCVVFFQAEAGIRDLVRSRGRGDVYKRQVYLFLLLPIRMALVGDTHGFLRSVGVIHWGLMTTVFCVSHLAFMLALPDLPGLKNSGVSLLFYLVVLTQLNDTAHYLVNRRFGRHPVLATVRPGLAVCLLYPSDAADEPSRVALGGRRII